MVACGVWCTCQSNPREALVSFTINELQPLPGAPWNLGMQSAAQWHQLAFPDRPDDRFRQVGALAAYETEQVFWVRSGQENLAAKNETLTWGDPFTRTLGATGSNQSQGEPMLARHWSFVSGSMVPSYASIVEFSSLATYPFFGVSSSGGGLFGHPVILNGSGALVICREVPQRVRRSHQFALQIGQTGRRRSLPLQSVPRTSCGRQRPG